MHTQETRGDGYSRRLRLWWLAVTLFIVYAATLPFDFVTTRDVIHEHVIQAVERSAHIEPSALSAPDVVQNVLLFVPFGLFGVASLRRRNPVTALATTVGLAAGLSITCELLQLFTLDRVTSLWDVLANVAGATVGGVGWVVIQRTVGGAERYLDVAALESGNLFPLCCAAALICTAAWEPFDVTLDVGTVWLKVKPFVTGTWVAWRPISDEFLTALRYALLAILAGRWRREERPGGRACLTAATGCTVLAVVLEASQFLISSRSPSVQDALAALCGILIGVAGCAVRQTSEATVVTLAIASAGAAVPFYLQPFVIAPRHSPVATLPFFAYYEFTSLQIVSHVVDLMLIFAPIGFAAEWSQPKRGLDKAVLVSLAIAAPLEYAQGWIVGRFPDVTDIGVAVLGAVAGALIARSGVEVYSVQSGSQY